MLNNTLGRDQSEQIQQALEFICEAAHQNVVFSKLCTTLNRYVKLLDLLRTHRPHFGASSVIDPALTLFPAPPTGGRLYEQAARDLSQLVCRPFHGIPDLAQHLQHANPPLGDPSEVSMGISLDWKSEIELLLSEAITVRLELTDEAVEEAYRRMSAASPVRVS